MSLFYITHDDIKNKSRAESRTRLITEMNCEYECDISFLKCTGITVSGTCEPLRF